MHLLSTITFILREFLFRQYYPFTKLFFNSVFRMLIMSTVMIHTPFGLDLFLRRNAIKTESRPRNKCERRNVPEREARRTMRKNSTRLIIPDHGTAPDTVICARV